MLILAIEAQINGAPIPNRLGAPMAALVRRSLEKLNARVANAITRVMAGALAPPPVAPRAASRPRPKSPAKPLTWSRRLRGWLPGWFEAEPLPRERAAPRPSHQSATRLSSPATKHRGEAPSPQVQPGPPPADPIAVEQPIPTPSHAQPKRRTRRPSKRTKRPNLTSNQNFSKKRNPLPTLKHALFVPLC